MPVKYRCDYEALDGTKWRIDISTESYDGDTINVRGGGQVCSITHDIGGDDPYGSAIIPSSAIINLLNTSGEIDLREIQVAQDRDFAVDIYRSGELEWKGYLIPDNVQINFRPYPYDIQLTATDGLSLLESIDLSIDNLAAPPGGAIRCPLNWLRICLFRSQNLGIMLPIRWSIGLIKYNSISSPADPLSGETPWNQNGDDTYKENYFDDKGERVYVMRDLRYIVEGLVKAFGCNIYQSGGVWWIVSRNHVRYEDGVVVYKECPATLGAVTIAEGSIDVNRIVGGIDADYQYIREDAVLTGKAAVKSIEVTYAGTINKNVVPNGDFDRSELAPLDWMMANVSGQGSIGIWFGGSINGQPGNSMQVRNDHPTNEAVVTYVGSVKLDSSVLFKDILLSYNILPLRGYPTDSDDKIIFTDNPFKISLSYQVDRDDGNNPVFFMNEFGFWQNQPSSLGLGVLMVGIYRNNYSPVTQTIRNEVWFEGSPNLADILSISIPDNIGSNPNMTEYSFTVTSLEVGNLELALIGLRNVISASSAPIQSEQYVMQSPTLGRVQYISDFVLRQPTARTHKSTIPPEYRFIYPMLEGARLNSDVINYQFRGRAGSNPNILMTSMGNISPERTPEQGSLKLNIFVKPGQEFVLDDVQITVQDNNDVIRAELSDNRGVEITDSMQISSGFSGFVRSTLMRSYNTSNIDMWWIDRRGVIASLTEHYARKVMRGRSHPLRVFNGSVNVRNKDWSFLSLLKFDGLEGVYTPIRTTWNTDLAEVNLIAVESRDDDANMQINHYGSNKNN